MRSSESSCGLRGNAGVVDNRQQMARQRSRSPTTTRSMERLYRAHYGFVWHTVRRFGVVPALTDDAVQDTFITAYRRFDELAMPTAKAWLYGIARRVASNYRRTDFRAVRRRAAMATATTDSTERAATPEAVIVVDRFLEGLEEIDRELFVLSEIEGMTGPEAAHALSLNTSTTYSRVQVLRRRFREAVAEPSSVTTAVREHQPRASAHGWALLLPELGITTAAPATGFGLFAKAATLAFGVVVATGATTVALRAEPTATTTASTTAPPDDREMPATATRVASLEPATLPASPPIAEAPAPTTPPVHASATHASVRPKSADAIARDHGLIKRANEQLRAGDAAAALATTSTHAREFPSSELADARAALRIEALCALDKTAQARGEARTLLVARPGSPMRGRIERSCAGVVVESPSSGQAQGR
ncbi:MAG TPA: sigma-70 family RNA polymerase sigma factor [Nannocystaceae bacterium]|nr:sigma-70 family RNA polymerase sigma factor [Nannocystaceae bacterium]